MAPAKRVYGAAEERLHLLISRLEEDDHRLAGEMRHEFDVLRAEPAAAEQVQAETAVQAPAANS